MTASPERVKEVLIIEDDPDHAQTLAWVLKLPDGESYHVQVTFTLEDALARLKHGGIDVILLDLSLPDADGCIKKVVETIKDAVPTVPVLVVTGMRKEDVEKPVKEAGAAAVFQKGKYTPEQIRAAMKKVQIFHDREHPVTEKLSAFGAKLGGLADAIRRKGDSADQMPAVTPEQIEQARQQRGEQP